MATLPKRSEDANRFIKKFNHDPSRDTYIKSGNEPGLFLRITKAGKYIWQLRYSVRYGDTWKNRKISLGEYSEKVRPNMLTMAQAEEKAGHIKHEVKHNGIDPLEEKKKKARERAEADRLAKLEDMKAVTMQQLFDSWFKNKISVPKDAKGNGGHKDGGKEAARWIKTKVLPMYGDMPVKDFGQDEFWNIVDPMRQEGKIRSALIIKSLLDSMFSFARARYKNLLPPDHNPLGAINPKKDIGSWGERSRVLCQYEDRDTGEIHPDELQQLFKQMEAAKLPLYATKAIHLTLATTCRISELLNAQWQHIDLHTATWRIPPENSKNGSAHLINLSDYALAHFLSLREITGGSRWCFPVEGGRQDEPKKDKPICHRNISRVIRDRQKPEGGNKSRTKTLKDALVLPRGQWTPHDLRRTSATLMGQLGIPGYIIEFCLNHKQQSDIKNPSMARIYNRSLPRNEMKNAWETLGAELERLSGYAISDDVKAWKNKKVISLR